MLIASSLLVVGNYIKQKIKSFENRFEKITIFQMNFKLHLTYNLRGAWHTMYAMLLSNFK